jgi:hypothetical protein
VTTAAKGPDPCTILTAAEVEQLIGASSEPPKPLMSGRECRYRAGKYAQLDLTYDTAPGRFDEVVRSAKPTPVTGVGEKAAEHVALGNYVLSATNGKYFVELSVYVGTNRSVDRAAAKSVMNRALGALA